MDHLMRCILVVARMWVTLARLEDLEDSASF